MHSNSKEKEILIFPTNMRGRKWGKPNLRFYIMYFLFCLLIHYRLFIAIIVPLQVVTFDGGEYVSMAGEFSEFRKVDQCHNVIIFLHLLVVNCQTSMTFFNFYFRAFFTFRFQMNSGTSWKQWSEKQRALKHYVYSTLWDLWRPEGHLA